MKILNLVLSIILSAGLLSCHTSQNTEEGGESVDTTNTVVFNADNAYSYVKTQCDFGPRVPGTEAHANCAAWLESTLRDLADSLIVQKGQVTTFDGKSLNISNFIAQFNPDVVDRRVLLLAHWDCRPWADADPDASKHSEAVMGANDGASGVGVLLEIARLMHEQAPRIGIDILLVDAEDWGTDNKEESWGLGTQYWTNNMHAENYKPQFAVLLDMVGAKGATFKREYFSEQYAEAIVDAVWNHAKSAGYGEFFLDTSGNGVTDDHVFINKAGISCIDIIDTRSTSSGFFEQWHTTKDDISNIDRKTLKAVGQTLTNMIFEF